MYGGIILCDQARGGGGVVVVMIWRYDVMIWRYVVHVGTLLGEVFH